MMPKSALRDLLSGPRFPIMVSLPRNDMALAQAALDGGASALKVHLNGYHRASGVTFGSFAEELPFLRELAHLSVSKAIMIGQETLPTAAEMAELATLGFDAFNLYRRFAKPYLQDCGMQPIMALDHTFDDADLATLAAQREAMIEASIIAPERYREPLQDTDLASYRHIVETTKLPVIVPSQKAVQPTDVARLKRVGVSALLIGVVVIGSDVTSIKSATSAMVAAT